MKIGGKFIAEEFDSIDGCSFTHHMRLLIGEECEVIEDYENQEKVMVKFNDGQAWQWLKSALKTIN